MNCKCEKELEETDVPEGFEDGRFFCCDNCNKVFKLVEIGSDEDAF